MVRGSPQVDTSVAGVVEARWGVRPAAAIARYDEPGWQWSPIPVEKPCPTCAGRLYGLYRAHPHRGKQQLQAAVVCATCPASFTLRELQLSQRSVLGELRPEAVARRAAEDAQLAALAQEVVAPVRERPAPETPVEPPPPRRRPAPKPPTALLPAPSSTPSSAPPTGPPAAAPVEQPPEAEPAEEVAPQPAARPVRRMSTTVMAARIRSILAGSEAVPTAPGEEPPLLPAHLVDDVGPVWWAKTTDPTLKPPPGVTGGRVIMPDRAEFDGLRALLTQEGVEHRSVRYWLEQETVAGDGDHLRATAWLSEVGGIVPDRCEPVDGDRALAARLAYGLLWDLHDDAPRDAPDPTPVDRFVPAEWLPFLPFPVFNPAQAQAAPHILDDDAHLLITAPTGAGKTAIGMLAVLRTILQEGRKAAWLVPQRSLTDELDRELETWRARGLRVERLSGEYAVDVERVRAADLWVATTEKFEAICRAASLQAALGEVGCLVVDEIHLLGTPGRGALLEALLARVRGADSPVRIVGLSATVSNAAEVAEWLEADLVATTWRPSRVTWQLPTVPAGSGFAANARLREQVVVDLTTRHTADQGSVLVFCGSKRNVRSTAMAIAAERGAPVHTVAADDVDGLTKVCADVGVRLHYADYEHKHAAERAFRERQADVLVATSTVAAGVNLPARAVIVRDTTVGGEPMDTSMVLQMFGRAGRIGAGETEGWSYLVVDEHQRAGWQARLVAGYSVYSRIHESLPDHVLAEVLQGRITSHADAEAWWVETLAHAQGDDAAQPVQDAVAFLVAEGHLAARPDGGLAITDLGRLTARMMVSTHAGHRLRYALGLLPTPPDPDAAEDALTLVLSVAVRDLAAIAVPDQVRTAVATAIKAGGRTSQITHTASVKGLGSQTTTAPGDLARAALLLAARSPHLFTGQGRRVAAGIPLSTLYPVFEQAPRYLSWLAAQGVLGTVHPWIAIVAADLDQRVRWRRLAPRRGAGRLLWLCEQMATRARSHDLVPRMWHSAVARGVRSPDWKPGRPPAGCELDQAGYTALLRERATTAALTAHGDHASVAGTVAATAVPWHGKHYGPPTPTKADTDVRYPDTDTPDDPDKGVAVFTRRGDYRATGWLAAYDALATDDPPPPPKPSRRGLGARS
ncbi:DEAD/DEAH box helicase [Actinosynnema sp. NPDC047251]|uniref:DEAD/DEAH box helicase domain protein n=1 Tax=Saccharothrix espanaensis (strain ATCC 51144 / DSM 44229 / JCM 9112 / NBRC 15066 / NRRL 15764) TaxID=1179773 RepID=K0JT69_SACES|nr:DEAD/DEAH box helicase [Saccharothrix espanaensis]CCH30975.1 DEAD/DEAH box helicase domain protein [Saccharothrix espanaensis DSM 44229]